MAAAASAALFTVQSARADDFQPIARNLFDSPGIVDMPSARMAPDGELSVGASFFKNTQHYNFGFQVTPWLETSFRYSGLTHLRSDYPVYYDRSFAMKLRLWDETDVFPALALGVDDIVGTGIYGSEFLVATKRFGVVDASIGMGWGRLATANTIPNPLGAIYSPLRRPREAADPGATNFTSLFHGTNAGIFGGLSWRTPIEGLQVSVEYSSDAYTREKAAGNLNPGSQFNFGTSYEVFDNATLAVNWLYGDSISASVSFALDPKSDPWPQRVGSQPVVYNFRTDEEQRHALNASGTLPGRQAALRGQQLDEMWASVPDIQDISLQGRTLTVTAGTGGLESCEKLARFQAASDMGLESISLRSGAKSVTCPVARLQFANITYGTNAENRSAPSYDHGIMLIDAHETGPVRSGRPEAAVRRAARLQSIGIESVTFRGGEAWVYFSNTTYQHEADAVKRLVRILMAEAPADVELFRLISVVYSVPQREFDVLRAPTEREASLTGKFSLLEGGNSSAPAPMDTPLLSRADRKSYPRFSWAIYPGFRQQLFDPNNPFAVQFVAGAGGSVEVMRGLFIQGATEVDLYDNFNTGRASDSLLPHVRSDFVNYFTKGKNGISQLEVNYQFRLAPDLYAAVTGGYLESMFAGVGGEVLWRPEGARWALGVDGYEVRQRNFDRLLGLRNYQTFTGHASIYYSSPWYNLDLAIKAGQYLAGDRGVTFEVTRRFDTGVEIGAFFTRTNVSSTQFGEGSFDKGIIIRIPLGWIAPLDTQSQLAMDLRPVQRDGGQRLAGDATLFNATRVTSLEEITRSDAKQ